MRESGSPMHLSSVEVEGPDRDWEPYVNSNIFSEDEDREEQIKGQWKDMTMSGYRVLAPINKISLATY